MTQETFSLLIWLSKMQCVHSLIVSWSREGDESETPGTSAQWPVSPPRGHHPHHTWHFTHFLMSQDEMNWVFWSLRTLHMDDGHLNMITLLTQDGAELSKRVCPWTGDCDAADSLDWCRPTAHNMQLSQSVSSTVSERVVQWWVMMIQWHDTEWAGVEQARCDADIRTHNTASTGSNRFLSLTFTSPCCCCLCSTG